MARCIMPRLLMKSIDGTIAPANSSIPAHFNHLKDLAITFIDHRIQTKSEEEADTVFRVLQNMCAKCPDRAEYRTKVAPVVAQVTLMLPRPLVQDFVDFLSIFAQSAKTAYRVFAVELAPQLVSRFPADKEEEAVFEQLRSTLLTMVLKRCNDKAPTVRTRALTILSTILSSADAVYSALLERISKELSLEEGDNGAEADDGYGSDHRVDRSSGDALMNLIEARCDDEKVFARKAAVLALEALYPVLNPESGLKALKMLKTRTLDISVMVRKQGADSLTHLLAAHPSDFVRNTWLQAVLPLVTDRESSVQTFVCKLISEALIAKINADDDANVWRLLALIEQQQDLRRYLLRALIHLAKENQLNQRIVAVLEEKTRDSDKSNAAWMLLAELSGVFKVNPKLARIRWYALDDSADRMLGYMAKIFAG
uniref:Uncharacterized protein n=1 Tax=Plectus sambesii TaxID=2011161 RepID=A0A914UW26_9BILA